MSSAEELNKLVGESILFDMNFSNRLATGETVSAVNSVTSSISGRVSGSTALTIGSETFSDSTVQFRISNGTANEVYEVIVSVTTSSGNIKIGKGLLRIE